MLYSEGVCQRDKGLAYCTKANLGGWMYTWSDMQPWYDSCISKSVYAPTEPAASLSGILAGICTSTYVG